MQIIMSESATDKGLPGSPLIGIMAFQGAYTAHERMLKIFGVSTLEVRTRDDIARCTHLVLPGGESTTFLKLLEFHDLTDLIIDHFKQGRPVLATCAGMILTAKEVIPSQRSLGLLDISIERNAYGSQVDSFEADLDIPSIGSDPFHGVFIRSPRVKEAGPSVEILSGLEGQPVLIRQGKIIAATFHPELTDDARIHEMFLRL